MAAGTGKRDALSIWFLVGVMTLLYGLVLWPYGAFVWFAHREAPTVLHTLHPTFWWGMLLTLFGAAYCAKYRPRPLGRPS